MNDSQNSLPAQASYQASVSDQWEFELASETAAQLDLVPLPDGQHQLLHEGKSYRVSLAQGTDVSKQMSVMVNGTRYEVSIADDFDQLVKRLGLSLKKEQKGGDVNAPMPGMVLDILVTEQQEVAEGDALIILEAMKMENVLKAAAAGTVQSIAVEKGQNVEKSQLLIEIA